MVCFDISCIVLFQPECIAANALFVGSYKRIGTQSAVLIKIQMPGLFVISASVSGNISFVELTIPIFLLCVCFGDTI